MNYFSSKYLAAVLLLVGVAVLAAATEQEKYSMTATGTFEVQLEPQDDGDVPAGRMTMRKTFAGDLEGTGVGQMISKRTAPDIAVYFAVEEVQGTVGGKQGGFTLIHQGRMNQESKSLEIEILAGSGAGELEGINGAMKIIQKDNGHQYELDYSLPGT